MSEKDPPIATDETLNRLGPADLVKLATAFARQGAAREASRVARRALEANPTEAALLANLGSIFSACQQFDAALVCFRRATEAEPANSMYRYGVATAQRALGNLAAAELSCDEALQRDPRNCSAYWLRSGLRTQSPNRNHVKELEAQLAADYPRAEGKALLSYALAKELEDLGEYARSFEHLKIGAATYRKLLRYDVESDVRAIECIIETHTAEALRAATAGHSEVAPVFVVGLPRSGTTLVERIVQSHTAVLSVGERNDFALELMRLTNGADAQEQVGRETRVQRSLHVNMSELGRRYVEAVTPGDTGTRRVLDKMPINYLYCGLIHAALPRAKIISLRRDPLDSCYAAFKTFLTGPYGFTYDLDELGRYYLAYHKLVEHWRATLPPHVYLEVRYEEIVADFESTARRILAFLDLPWQETVAGFFKNDAPSATASAAQVRQPVYATSVGKWLHYREQLAPLAKRLSHDIPEIDASSALL